MSEPFRVKTRTRRIGLGWARARLAEKAGMSPEEVVAIEDGHERPGKTDRERLERALSEGEAEAERRQADLDERNGGEPAGDGEVAPDGAEG